MLKSQAAVERMVREHVKQRLNEDAVRRMMVRVSPLTQKGLTTLTRLADELPVAIVLHVEAVVVNMILSFEWREDDGEEIRHDE